MEKRNDARKALVAQIQTMLDSGVVPWRKPWVGRGGWPVNVQTGRRYRGWNAMLLMWQGEQHWAGYGQWRKVGAQVRKGEKAVAIWRPSKWAVNVDKATGGKFRFPIRFTHVNVFSAGQVDGWTAPKVESNDIAPIDAAEAIVNAMPNPPTLVHLDGDHACYRPTLDKVDMPNRDQFTTAEGYYGTMFHELAHATGHVSRCNRKDMGDMSKHAYSREELVAEFASMFLCAECGIAPAVIGNAAAYIRTWRDRITNAPEILDGVITDAQKAADYVTGQAAESKAADAA